MSVQLSKSGSVSQNEKPSQEKSLQTLVIDSEDKEALENECLICMESICLNQTVIKMACHHYYHRNCIMKWLSKTSSCPHCRQLVVDNPFLQELDSTPTADDLQMALDRTVHFVLRGVPEEDLIDSIDDYERLVRQYIYNDSDSDLSSEEYL